MSDPNQEVEPWLLKIDSWIKKSRVARAARAERRTITAPAITQAVESPAKPGWSKRTLWVAGTAAAAIVVIGVGVGVTTNLVRQAQQQAEDAEFQRIAAEQRALNEEAEKQQQEQEDAEEKDAQKQALEDVPDTLVRIDAAIAAAPWAAEADVTALTGIRTQLEASRKARNGADALRLIYGLPSFIDRLGTADEAQDRIFYATLNSLGIASASPSSTYYAGEVVKARQWCADISAQWQSQRSAAAQSLYKMTDTTRKAAIPAYCPDMAAAQQAVDGMISDGDHTIGTSMAPGVWRTIRSVSDCYWERHTGGGDIIDNAFITAAPDGATVEVYGGEGFSTQGCGLWERIG